ncbi:hypothetical protein TIFTF001_046859 [Ficus carica]|uniref:Uncharacterized protein n=2 Tax=Ficus carica TaxID=3494 RepID=A0AA87YTY0_FICCA|nr:hypothetical protein TIFTF001_046859 [Ficus carica]
MDWPSQPLHSYAPGTDTYVMGPIRCVMFRMLRYLVVVLAERKLTVLRLCYRYTDMDPRRLEEDRYAIYAYNGMQPLLFGGTHWTVSLSAWLYDLEMIFHLCHIEANLQVSLASRCLIADLRLWWMTRGEWTLPERTWVHFRAIVMAHLGPILEEGAGESYRDPEIYRDM